MNSMNSKNSKTSKGNIQWNTQYSMFNGILTIFNGILRINLFQEKRKETNLLIGENR